jgi:hypothetical protein
LLGVGSPAQSKRRRRTRPAIELREAIGFDPDAALLDPPKSEREDCR